MAYDSYWTNVKLLVPADGTITDISGIGRTLTAVGNAASTATGPKWGSGCLVFDGTGDAVTAPDATDLDLTGDFTIECWVKLASKAAQQGFISKRTDVGQFASYMLYYNQTSDRFGFRASTANSANDVDLIGTTSPSTGTWYYLAAKHSGTTWSLWIGASGSATQEASATVAGNPYNSAAALALGAGAADASQSLDGNLDDVRITLGVARDVSTVPTEAFPTSAYPDNFFSRVTMLASPEQAAFAGPRVLGGYVPINHLNL